MAFINQHQKITTKTELDLFATPPTQTSVESGKMMCYRPISTISNDAPIEFHIPGAGDEYIDLSRTMLYLKARIKVNSEIAADKSVKTPVVAPVNNWLHSSQIDIYLNQKCVTPPSNSYNYRSYIEHLLNFGSDSKSSHLTTSLFYADTARNFEKLSNENAGFVKRYEMAKEDIEMYGNLHCDIFNQDKYLLNGVDLSIKLQHAKKAFYLMGEENANVEVTILEAELHTRKVKINTSILLAHARALAVATCKYNITRVDVKSITIASGLQAKTIDNLYMGQLPKRCIIGFVDSRAYNGNIKFNPYNFQHYDHNFLCLYMDSVQIPSKPLTPDFSKNQFIRSYHSLFDGCGINFADAGNCISRSDYPHGYCLSAFDLTADLSCNDSHWNIIKSGSLRVEIKFSTPLPKTITVLIFAEFDNCIEIDSNRQVSLDYSS